MICQLFIPLLSGPETWDTMELYWDLYLLTVLLGLLGLVMVLRRPRLHQPPAQR